MNAFTEHGLSVLLRDVTERKRAEILNYEQLEMKSLSQTQEIRLLGLLTSGVAHEVRNPLNAISVVLEALFRKLVTINILHIKACPCSCGQTETIDAGSS